MLAWALVELVGGSLACEGVEGACSPGAVDGLAGGAIIAAGAGTIGWLTNRVVARIRRWRSD